MSRPLFSIRIGPTYLIRLKAQTEEEAKVAFDLVCKLNDLVSHNVEGFGIMWTPGYGVTLHKKEGEYPPVEGGKDTNV